MKEKGPKRLDMYIVQCILKEVLIFLQSVATSNLLGQRQRLPELQSRVQDRLVHVQWRDTCPVLVSCPRFYVPFLEILREEMQNCVQDLMWPVVSTFLDLKSWTFGC